MKATPGNKGTDMQYGLSMMTRGPCGSGPGLTQMAKAAEAGGLDYLGINDHVVVPADIASRYPYSGDGVWPGATVGQCLEVITAASYIAAATSRALLLTSVLVVPYRPAVLTAKMLTTLDVMSGGRLTIGCGAGWMREEFDALGTDPFDERGKVTDEYLRVFRALWTGETPSFEGDYVNFDPIFFEPKPVQQPGPPIWVGGESAAAIRRTVELGDGWCPASHNPRAMLDTPRRYAAMADRLHQAAEAAGRDPASIAKVLFVTSPVDPTPRMVDGERRAFTGNVDDILADIDGYRAVGVDTLIFGLREPDLNATLDRIGWLTESVVAAARA